MSAKRLPREQKLMLRASNEIPSRSHKNANKANGGIRKNLVTEPPDGGFKAYSVAIASFVTNGLIFGVINSYSVIYTVLVKRIQAVDDNAEVKCALVGSLSIGTTFALSPVSGVLVAILGLRVTSLIGGCIAIIGLILSSFVVDKVEALCFTYGIMYGLGVSLSYTPSLAILGQYFKKRLGLVNGFVTIGSCAFTVFMPSLLEWLIESYSLEVMFRFLCLVTVGILLCGLQFTPVPGGVEETKKQEQDLKAIIKAISCNEMCRIKKYKYWAISMPIAMCGYFVPYVHIKALLEERKFETSNLNLPLECIAVTSAIGRLIFGFLGDSDNINRITLQQISFYAIGVFTIILPFVRVFWLIVVIALGMGLFEGGFIALVGPVAIQLAGPKYAAKGIGCMLGIAAYPLSIGPSLAGAIHKINHDYTLPFVLAGLSPIIGATLLFYVKYVDKLIANNDIGA